MLSRAGHRLLLIAPGCDATDVGEAWSNYQWVSGLAKANDVTLLTYRKRNRLSAAAQLPGVRVVEWVDWPLVGRYERFNSMLKPGYLGFYAAARRWIRKALRRGERFDLIHQISPLAIRYPSPATGFGIPFIVGPLGGSICTPPAFEQELRGVRWYTRLRSLDSFRFRWDPWMHRTLTQASAVIVVAPYVRELLGRVKIRRFAVMSETGVKELPTLLARAAAPAGQMRMLFVGRVVRTKGVRDIIRALAHLKDLPDIRLDVVGDGDDLSECRREAEELGVSGRVQFHGRLKRELVNSHYASADLFIFPSVREPSGNAVLEAMSYGLPLIVASNGGPAFAASPACALQVLPEHPARYAQELAAAIRILSDDPARRIRMGTAARELVMAKHLWKEKLTALSAVYEDVLQQGAPVGRHAEVQCSAH